MALLTLLGPGAGIAAAQEAPDRDGSATGDVSVVAPDGLTGDPATDLTTIGDALGHAQISLNMLWLVIAGVLVIFMQAGFAMVETGFCQAKHAAHVVSTNFLVFSMGAIGFLFVRYSIMFGNATAPAIGLNEPFGVLCSRSATGRSSREVAGR